MKMLFVLNLANRVNSFSYASMRAAENTGVDFHIAGNWGYGTDAERLADAQKLGIHIHQIEFVREPYDLRNIKAMRQLVELVEHEKYDMIHCNTPIGGLLGRLAGKKCKTGKVIYQVHGFHFYKGAPLLNWLIYYPIERWLARYTDALITINKEDYDFARKRMRLRGNGRVYYVPGVGIDTTRFQMGEAVRDRKRQELGLSDEDLVLISAGELNENKNNTVILSALEKLKNPRIHYVLCGVGDQETALRRQAEQSGIGQQVHFLGYRQDMKELLQAADIFVMPSYREGLSRSIMEAMATRLPCVVSRIRGNVDLIEEGQGGYLREPDDAEGFADAISRLARCSESRKQMGVYNMERVREFDSSVVEKKIIGIYSEMLK